MEALAGVGGIEAYAFAMGVAAVFNPCGVALLPASLAWVGGTAVEAGSAGARMVRGLVAGLLMALGFTAVVAVLAAALHGLGAVIGTILHPAMIVLAALIMVGGGLVAFGLLYVPVDRLVTWRGTTTRSLHWTWLLAGVVYGVAALSCTLPLFIAAFLPALAGGWLNTVGLVAAFGAGTALVLVATSLAVVVARDAAASVLRRVTPWLNPALGTIVAAAGAYLLYYWVLGPGRLVA